MSSVAGVIIGNEVLSAKVTDANGPLLAQRLRERCIPFSCLLTVPDEIDAIVEAVSWARRRASAVITSGGIGPTHDDITVRAVSLALGRRVVHLPEMVELVKAWHGGEVNPKTLRLAEAPEGSRLVELPGAVRFPVLTCEGVYLLPGVPRLFQLQLEAVLRELPSGTLTLRELYVSHGEADLAAALDAVALDMPQVAIGSYPVIEPESPYRVKITIEHAERGPADEALARLEALIPAEWVVRRT
jgi:molybdenum cofactor synthesis domain-containing protein